MTTSDIDVPQAWIDELDEVDMARRRALVAAGRAARRRLLVLRDEALHELEQADEAFAAGLRGYDAASLASFDAGLVHQARANRILDGLLFGLSSAVDGHHQSDPSPTWHLVRGEWKRTG